jgi:hypothetical protein
MCCILQRGHRSSAFSGEAAPRLASVPGAQVAGSDGGRAADIGSPAPAPARTSGPGDADPVNSTRGGTPSSGSASSRPGARGGAGTSAASWRERAGPWLRALHRIQRRSPGLAPLHRIPAAAAEAPAPASPKAAGKKEKEVAGRE